MPNPKDDDIIWDEDIVWDGAPETAKKPTLFSATDAAMKRAYGTAGVPSEPATPVEQAALAEVESELPGAPLSMGGGIANVAQRSLGGLADWLGGKLAAAATGAKGLETAGEQALLKQGLWGTKGMMSKQVAAKKAAAGERLGEAAGEIAGGFETKPVADAVAKVGKRLELEVPGKSTAASQPALDSILKRVEDITQRGSTSGTPGVVSAQQMQKAKTIAALEGWTEKAAERSGIQKAAARAENVASGDILEKAYGEQFAGMPNKYAAANLDYGALSAAERGLEKEPSLLSALIHPLKTAAGAPLTAAAAQATRIVPPVVDASIATAVRKKKK